MSRRGTLIFLRPPVFLPAYVSVRLCFFQSMFLPAYVSVPPMFPSACVSASLRLRLRPPVPLPVCVLASLYPVSLHPQHCSAPSLISPIFIQLIRFFVLLACPVLSFFPLSNLFIPLLPLFLFLFTFSSSLIFSLPILLTLLVPTATHLFLSKTLYREHTLRNCDVPHAATHPFELKTLYRERGELRRP